MSKEAQNALLRVFFIWFWMGSVSNFFYKKKKKFQDALVYNYINFKLNMLLDFSSKWIVYNKFVSTTLPKTLFYLQHLYCSRIR